MQSSPMLPDSKFRRLSLLLWLAGLVFAVSRRLRRPRAFERIAVAILHAAVKCFDHAGEPEPAAELALYC